MPAARLQNESPETSLKVLLHFLRKPEFADLREFLKWDCFTKYAKCHPASQLNFCQQYLALMDPHLEHLLPQAQPTVEGESKRRVDVVLVTVIKEELRAAKAALDIAPDARETTTVNGLRFWETEVAVESRASPIRVVLTMIGDARNIECAVAMRTVLNSYATGLCVLIGIAGGLKSKTKIGDVVIPFDMLIDYEGQRLEPEGARPRPKPYALHSLIKRDLGYFDPVRNGWTSRLRAVAERLFKEALIPEESMLWKPECHQGVILSGECLLADGSLDNMQAQYSEKVRAIEQEGSGFAAMCNENRVPWVIFRGISDFGETPKPNQYQIAAALSACTCAIRFIQTDYRLPQITEKF